MRGKEKNFQYHSFLKKLPSVLPPLLWTLDCHNWRCHDNLPETSRHLFHRVDKNSRLLVLLELHSNPAGRLGNVEKSERALTSSAWSSQKLVLCLTVLVLLEEIFGHVRYNKRQGRALLDKHKRGGSFSSGNSATLEWLYTKDIEAFLHMIRLLSSPVCGHTWHSEACILMGNISRSPVLTSGQNRFLWETLLSA